MYEIIRNSLFKLVDFCESEEYKGYDPYDGLNSQFFKAIPLFNNSYFARIVWTQIFKRSPLNLRRIVGVKKDYNPKGLGLFLSSYCNLYQKTCREKYLDHIYFLSAKLLELQNKDWSGPCWGYNFDWQARAFFQPKNTPTVVASVYIASALLDMYNITNDEKLLNIARGTCNFILKDLNRNYNKKGNFSFSYSPLDKSIVFNASLLGSRLLARVYNYTKEDELIVEAKKSIDFCLEYQNVDGSWSYGTLPFHKWKDNFHTGYNLECIAEYMKFSQDYSYKTELEKGFNYYARTFFTEKGIPKYYDDSVYPIDIHCTAQMIITFLKLNRFEEYKHLIDNVLGWTIKNMQSKKGYFYYQKNKYFSSKIPYIRWGQAWMLYALSSYMKEI